MHWQFASYVVLRCVYVALLQNPEFNQYWYSKNTINVIAGESRCVHDMDGYWCVVP